MTDVEWYRTFFGPGYLSRYEHLLDREATSREIDLILDLLKPSPGDRILDIPCGFGRHALELSRRSFQVTGVDLIPAQLEKARELMKREGLSYTLVEADMKEIAFSEGFDILLNLFNSFGYFDEAGNLKLAANFSRALKPGGKLLLETLNRDGFLAACPRRYWQHLSSGHYLLEETEYDQESKRMRCHQIMLNAGGSEETELDCRLYSPDELADLFVGVGLQNPKILSPTGDEFTPTALRFMLLMEKPLP